MNAGNRIENLVNVLREARTLLALPDIDFSRSSRQNTEAVFQEIDGLMLRVESCLLPPRLDLEVLFAIIVYLAAAPLPPAFVHKANMPLPLDDNRWNSLQTAYKMPATDVVEWLATAYQSGMTDELLGDIINEVQHQGDTSEAMYPTGCHLLALTQRGDRDISLQMIIQAGLTCASAQSQTAVQCPPDLEAELTEMKLVGRRMALSELACEHDFENFKYLLAALAGFSDHGRFGRIIEGFDLFENQFHHALLDDPLDDEP